MQRKSTFPTFAALALIALVATAEEPPSVIVTGGKVQAGTLTRGGAVFKGDSRVVRAFRGTIESLFDGRIPSEPKSPAGGPIGRESAADGKGRRQWDTSRPTLHAVRLGNRRPK